MKRARRINEDIDYGVAHQRLDGIVVVERRGKYGVEDMNNNVIVPYRYDYLKGVGNNFFIAEKNGKYGVIDIDNNVIIPFIYGNIFSDDTQNNFFIAEKNGKYGVIDIDGDAMIPFVYKGLNFTENKTMIAVKNNNKYGVIGATGKIVVPFEYDYIDSEKFGNNYHSAKKDGMYGAINIKGDIVIPFEYNDASELPIETNENLRARYRNTKHTRRINESRLGAIVAESMMRVLNEI